MRPAKIVMLRVKKPPRRREKESGGRENLAAISAFLC